MTKHTPGATEAARVIMAGKAKVETEYGKKTLEGIADLIDRKTAAPKLLEAAKQAREHLVYYRSVPAGQTVIDNLDTAIAKAEAH